MVAVRVVPAGGSRKRSTAGAQRNLSAQGRMMSETRPIWSSGTPFSRMTAGNRVHVMPPITLCAIYRPPIVANALTGDGAPLTCSVALIRSGTADFRRLDDLPADSNSPQCRQGRDYRIGS